jgi:hypothetical protein
MRLSVTEARLSREFELFARSTFGKDEPMSIACSILRNPFFSMSLIAGSVAATGCVDSTQPGSTETADSAADHVAVTDGEALSGLAVQTVQYQHTAQGDRLSAPGLTQTAPGEWTLSASGTTMSVKVSPAPTPNILVTCNLNFYIGISSPVVGFIGEAAIGQLDCLDGAVTTTITTQACTDFGCNVPASATGTASPGLPFTSGVAVPGTAGAACSGTVFWSPPGAAVSAANPCG